jgi:hypothetical protein
MKRHYLTALPTFPGGKGFSHRTILVFAKDENDARALARHIKPNDNIGDIKEVQYAYR